MKASQTRHKAREVLINLPGKYRLFLVPILSPIVIIFLASFLFAPFSRTENLAGFLIFELIIVVLLVSLFFTSASYAMLDVVRKKRETVGFNDNFIVFSKELLPKFLFLAIWQTIFLFLWAMLLGVGAAIITILSAIGVSTLGILIGIPLMFAGYVMVIIKSYSYAMSTYILYDEVQNGTYTNSRAIIKKSVEMMRGNKWRYFCLQFSFIGWSYLTLLTFGLLSFYVLPYMTTATLFFYDDLVEKTKEVEEIVEEVNENE